MNRYGLHETPVQLDCEWATLDAVIHWELTCDDYRDVFEILKVSIGSLIAVFWITINEEA